MHTVDGKMVVRKQGSPHEREARPGICASPRLRASFLVNRRYPNLIIHAETGRSDRMNTCNKSARTSRLGGGRGPSVSCIQLRKVSVECDKNLVDDAAADQSQRMVLVSFLELVLQKSGGPLCGTWGLAPDRRRVSCVFAFRDFTPGSFAWNVTPRCQLFLDRFAAIMFEHEFPMVRGCRP
jgi:hypothetical protein